MPVVHTSLSVRVCPDGIVFVSLKRSVVYGSLGVDGGLLEGPELMRISRPMRMPNASIVKKPTIHSLRTLVNGSRRRAGSRERLRSMNVQADSNQLRASAEPRFQAVRPIRRSGTSWP